MSILANEVMIMQETPYYCPDCRSNRVKFNIITSYSQSFLKDALTGSIMEIKEALPIPEAEPTIQCLVCNFIGNELRFIKQAEREPRVDPMNTIR
jgi:Zn finger protein HypA/HybF involved in hydrogenase expression